MSTVMSPAKLILLAVYLAAKADVDSLGLVTSLHPTALRRDLVLRILLTYLPETLPSERYVGLLEEVYAGEFADRDGMSVDYSLVNGLTTDEALKKVRKLRLLSLYDIEASHDFQDDPVALFLLRRAYRVDEEAGLLAQLPTLLAPFLHHNAELRTWVLSVLLPLLRRNYEYHPAHPTPYTLVGFQRLPDAAAARALLSQTGEMGDYHLVGRDLRGLIGPWLHSDARWAPLQARDSPVLKDPVASDEQACPGWEAVLEWLLDKALNSWKVAAAAIQQWNGAEDADLGDHGAIWMQEEQQRYLERRYLRAILACAYVIPEATVEALDAAHQMVAKALDLLGEDEPLSLSAAADLSHKIPVPQSELLSRKNTTFMRDNLLREENPLTRPAIPSVHLLHLLILSAFISTRAGSPISIKQAGDLLLLRNEIEQKAEAVKLIRAVAHNGSKHDDNYWRKFRLQLLWLRDWGIPRDSGSLATGILGSVDAQFLEAEFLKVLLSQSRYSLARDLYEDSVPSPLSDTTLQDTIVGTALLAYDNASNPNRTRGGLRKCDEIIKAFPTVLGPSQSWGRKIEALLRATHSLSSYRLVLKQGEPFTPVVLRVHSDPVSIIGKVLEQNTRSYTKIQDLLEVGRDLVKAELVSASKADKLPSSALPGETDFAVTDRRVTALCIEAALAEHDFETAYSYIVSRLKDDALPSSLSTPGSEMGDQSWRAALQAGQYTRTSHTIRPTHLGTASGNPDIRHLEQRLECLSTALRLAPSAQLQDVLKTFRRCEEHLNSAIIAENAREADEEAVGLDRMPGGFHISSTNTMHPTRPTGMHAGSDLQTRKSNNVEDAPISLFDLSRATARAASRNFSALSNLQQSSGVSKPSSASEMGNSEASLGLDEDQHPERVRRRDQLREAAMGTLTSGVGWLIGAPTPGSDSQRE